MYDLQTVAEFFTIYVSKLYMLQYVQGTYSQLNVICQFHVHIIVTGS